MPPKINFSEDDSRRLQHSTLSRLAGVAGGPAGGRFNTFCQLNPNNQMLAGSLRVAS